MNDDDWIDHEDPTHRGHYLVQQENADRKKYRWVRYWDGQQWSNTKEEVYGPVVCWAHLPNVR